MVLKCKIIAMGGTARAVPTLQSLLHRNDIEVSLVVAMRGYNDESIYASDLGDLANAHGIRVIIADNVSEDLVEMISSLSVDAIIGIGVWRSILTKQLLDATKFGFLAMHGTPLPKYRGWAGINWQIINGDSEIRMHGYRLGSGVDDGQLICDGDKRCVTGAISLDNEKHLYELFIDYQDKHVFLINRIVDLLVSGDISFIHQIESNATYACHRGPDDGEINWNESTIKIFNFIRGQSKPYSGAFTYYNGRRIHVWRATKRPDFSNYEGRIPGKIVHRSRDNGSAIILTSDSAIEVLDASIYGDQIPKVAYEIFDSVRNRCKSRADAYLDTIGF